jgi:hypothetical protein
VAVSGARLDDFLGLYDLYARADRRPKRVLLALDPWSLSGDGNAILWGAIASERAEMLDTLRIPHSTLRDRIRLELSALVRLGSPEYFRLAVLSLRHHGVHGIHYVVTDVAQNVEKTKAPDGSIVWSPVSPDSADFMAREYVRRIRAHIASYDGRDEPSDGSLATLERFLLRLKHDGVSTDIVLSPFHPFVYAELVQQPGASINEVEREYRIVASRVGARVFGSYDPATVGMTGADFFDESHMRSASLARLVR